MPDHPQPAPPGDPPALEWRAWPLRERPLPALAASGVIIALGALAGLAVNSALAGAAAVVLQVLLLAPFFLPTRFRLDDRGVRIDALTLQRELAWDAIRRCTIGRRGAWISTLRRPGPLEARRGILLLYGRHQAAVVAHLKAHLPADIVTSA
jgi:hypothetical protein